ncbi:virion protein [uncultured Caudovirales phage]|uniref:Virion protein n=1 Tax=uncultured Caudovirales phage TaxID=2100421 RepID=A0A6J5L4Q0_9CAUD|nr:virion protein [uncultured Caudovirales phage]
MPQPPLGVSLNNWCNIRHVVANAWQGLAVPPSAHGFCHFVAADYGIRAAIIILRKHQAAGAGTIAQQIAGIGADHRFAWAPATENDTATYISHMATWMNRDGNAGWTADTPLDLWKPEQAVAFLLAMVRQEVGLQPKASESIIRIGVAMAPQRGG